MLLVGLTDGAAAALAQEAPPKFGTPGGREVAALLAQPDNDGRFIFSALPNGPGKLRLLSRL
ncbi:hypothetical protein D0N36_19600 [Hymenobacter lapidiphilus]|nr:hypothetical protein D0N36_19600 [Hymenobacter sp. CCM 8763]